MNEKKIASVTSIKRLILPSRDFVKNFEPPDYLIEGILQRRFIYSMTGTTGAGKSAVALVLCALVALGRSMGVREVERGRALYFAGENPDDIKMRWILMSEEMDFDINKVDVHFIEGSNHKVSEDMGRIREEVDRLGGVQLIIVDTSAAYFEGNDENQNTDAGDHARMLRQLTTMPGGPCVVVLCHPVKSATEHNLWPRGGGAFVFELDGNMPCINDDGLVRVERDAQKFRGPIWDPIAFELVTLTTPEIVDSKDRSIPVVMAKVLSDRAYRERQTSVHDDQKKVLVAMFKNKDASYADIAKTCGWTYRGGGPDKSKVQRIFKGLVKGKLIAKTLGVYELTTGGEKIAKKSDTSDTADDD